jgi:prepilin-type N-terminal cleavage/methylation domain-containing protein/prepilin-type processing-associated H-X9-DG protein
MSPTFCRKRAAGLTLVELLVVIAIIGVLIALLLPAVQAAREAARRSACQNNVRQLAIASQVHLDVHGFFPSGGWAGNFLADPNRGVGRSQPGGWLFSALPYVEQQSLYVARGERLDQPELSVALKTLFESAPAMFYCPSRRTAKAYPFKRSGNGAWAVNVAPGVLELEGVTKSDYAANSGDTLYSASDAFSHLPPLWFPRDYASLESGPAPWSETNDATTPFYQSGVSFYRSEVRPAQIEDGLSNTYLCGEKFLSPMYYEDVNGTDAIGSMGDNQSAWAGYEWDNHRVAWKEGAMWPAERYQPQQDSDDKGPNWAANIYAFGSAHPGALNMAMCDGSVRGLAYDVDQEVHRQAANRLDGGE